MVMPVHKEFKYYIWTFSGFPLGWEFPFQLSKSGNLPSLLLVKKHQKSVNFETFDNSLSFVAFNLQTFDTDTF